METSNLQYHPHEPTIPYMVHHHNNEGGDDAADEEGEDDLGTTGEEATSCVCTINYAASLFSPMPSVGHAMVDEVDIDKGPTVMQEGMDTGPTVMETSPGGATSSNECNIDRYYITPHNQ